MNKLIKHSILFIILFIIGIPLLFYRFRHPDQTDTRRLLNIFEAYREFFDYEK